MLIIRQEQMQEFGLSAIDRALRRLMAYVRQRFPAEFKPMDDGALAEFVGRTCDTADQYGVEKENDLATFLDLTVMYGEGFDKAAWAVDILACDELHGPDKMAILRHRVRQSGANL